MTFVDRPLPEGLELPKLREKRQVSEKSLANLTYREGRVPGSINKISKDLKSGILNGAIAYGADGQGTGGLDGYLYMCAGRYPKSYMELLGKLMPLQVSPTPTVLLWAFASFRLNQVTTSSPAATRSSTFRRPKSLPQIEPPEPERYVAPEPIAARPIKESPSAEFNGHHVMSARLRELRARDRGDV